MSTFSTEFKGVKTEQWLWYLLFQCFDSISSVPVIAVKAAIGELARCRRGAYVRGSAMASRWNI